MPDSVRGSVSKSSLEETVNTFHPSTQEAKGGEFEVSLVYRMSSRTVMTVTRETLF